MAKYNGRRKIQQLAHLKLNYKGKNESGGRMAYCSQSSEYKRYCTANLKLEHDANRLLGKWTHSMAGLYRDSLDLAINGRVK